MVQILLDRVPRLRLAVSATTSPVVNTVAAATSPASIPTDGSASVAKSGA